MYRRELIGMEEKVKETAEQIEELLKSMRGLEYKSPSGRLCVTRNV